MLKLTSPDKNQEEKRLSELASIKQDDYKASNHIEKLESEKHNQPKIIEIKDKNEKTTKSKELDFIIDITSRQKLMAQSGHTRLEFKTQQLQLRKN